MREMSVAEQRFVCLGDKSEGVPVIPKGLERRHKVIVEEQLQLKGRQLQGAKPAPALPQADCVS